MSAPVAWPHRELIRVRYQEVDLQRVVFNAHYLTWCDLACAGWMQAAVGWTGVDDDIDWMVVRAAIDWQGSATYGDEVAVVCGIARWGRTSFAIAYRGTVEDRPVFTGELTYVCVLPGTKQPEPVPDRLRAALAMAPSTS